MAKDNNPSGLVPNAPDPYDELYDSVTKKITSLNKKLRSGDRVDVDKAFMNMLDDVSEVTKLKQYKGSKDPIWGLLNSSYENIITGYDSEGRAKRKKTVKVFPDFKSAMNDGVFNAKIDNQLVADFNVWVEDKRLKQGQHSSGKRTPNTEAGGNNENSEDFGGKENELDNIAGEGQEPNQSETKKVPVKRDANGAIENKEQLKSQKKIADKALETGKWYGINTKTNLLHGPGQKKPKPLNDADRGMLENISSKIEKVLIDDTVNSVDVERPRIDDAPSPNNTLIPLGNQVKQQGGGFATSGAPRRNAEAMLRNTTEGPLIPSVVDDFLEEKKQREKRRTIKQPGGNVVSRQTGNAPLQMNVRNPVGIAQGDVRIPEVMADYESRRGPRDARGDRVGVMPEIGRMPPAQPTGRFEQPPIRLLPQGTKPVSQPALILDDTDGATYNPNTTPIADFSGGNSEIGIPKALEQAERNRRNPPLGEGFAAPKPVDPQIARADLENTQRSLGYQTRPSVEPPQIRPDGAGPLVPPAPVEAGDRINRAKQGMEFAGNNASLANQRFDANPDMREMETNRTRAARVESGDLKGPFESQLDSASNTEVLSDNDTRVAKAEAQLEDLPEKRKKQIRARVKKIGGLTTGLVGIIAAGTASAARFTGTDAGNAAADYIDAGMEAYVDNVTMRGYDALGADREKMLGSDLSLAEDISRGIIPDTIADVAGLAGLISGG